MHCLRDGAVVHDVGALALSHPRGDAAAAPAAPLYAVRCGGCAGTVGPVETLDLIQQNINIAGG